MFPNPTTTTTSPATTAAASLSSPSPRSSKKSRAEHKYAVVGLLQLPLTVLSDMCQSYTKLIPQGADIMAQTLLEQAQPRLQLILESMSYVRNQNGALWLGKTFAYHVRAAQQMLPCQTVTCTATDFLPHCAGTRSQMPSWTSYPQTTPCFLSFKPT